MAQAAYYYAAGETQKAEKKMLEVKTKTEEATADLRELQYWTEIANTIIRLAQVVGNLTIGGKTGKLIREYTEKRMDEISIDKHPRDFHIPRKKSRKFKLEVS